MVAVAKRKEWIVWGTSLFLALLSAIYLFVENHRDDDYRYIAALPFTFLVCGIVFANVRTVVRENIGVFLLHAVVFMRLVVVPFLMSLSEYAATDFRGIAETQINAAIALMCYECVAIYLVLSIMTLMSGRESVARRQYVLSDAPPSSWFRAIVFAMTLYCVAVWIGVPTCRQLYKTAFEFGSVDFATSLHAIGHEQVGTSSRSLQTLFKMFFDILRIVLPVYLLTFLKRRGFRPKTVIFWGVATAAAQMLFIPATTARAVISAFIIIYFLARFYPEYSAKITRGAIWSVCAMVAVYFTVRFVVGSRYGKDLFAYLSHVTNAYFCSIDNVAAGENLPTGYEASTLWGCFYSAIPFNSTLFGLQVMKLQSIYNEVNGSYGQIPPMIVEGAYYFGYVLAPLFSCVCAAGAFYFGKRFANTTSGWHLASNLFLAILCAIAIVVYNETIFLVWLCEWLIPMKILSRLADRDKKRRFVDPAYEI